MTWFLTPMAGVILALCVIPPLIILYFLKLRRRPQTIGSTLLWKRAIEDLRANAPFQRLRRSLLLLLQLIALTLLCLAIMQPQMQAGGVRGGKTVLLVDTSASMTATDAGNPGSGPTSRLDEAKRLIRDRIEAMYAGGVFGSAPGETMIVAFSDKAEILCRFTDSRRELLAAIDRIEPTHGTTRLEEALKLARAYTTNVLDAFGEPGRPVGEPPALELFSDGRILDVSEQVLRASAGETLVYHPIGTPTPDNVAISSISVERPYDRPASIEVFTALLNFNESPITCDIELSVNGNIRAINAVNLPAARIDDTTGAVTPGRNNVVFTPFEQPRDAVIIVRNLRADHLLADNAVQLVVPPARRLRVALVEPKSFVLRNALAGLPLERPATELSAAEFQQMLAENRYDEYDVFVLDDPPASVWGPSAGTSATEGSDGAAGTGAGNGASGPDSTSTTRGGIAGGRYLNFGRAPAILGGGFNEYGSQKNQIMVEWREDHPILRYVNFDNLFISESRLIQPGEDLRVLAEATAGPVIVSLSRGALQVVHVTFAPLDSNWPFLRSWPTFIFNAVEFLGYAGEAITSQGFEPGQAITARLASGSTNLRMTMPDGTSRDVPSIDPANFSWGPARLTGLHELTYTPPGAGNSPQTRSFAVNLLSETEGDLRPAEKISIGTETIAGTSAADARYTPLWPWAVALCLIVLMLEWWVYHRKTYV